MYRITIKMKGFFKDAIVRRNVTKYTVEESPEHFKLMYTQTKGVQTIERTMYLMKHALEGFVIREDR